MEQEIIKPDTAGPKAGTLTRQAAPAGGVKR